MPNELALSITNLTLSLAETLLSQILLPLISFTEKDARLWQHDPHEFIRSYYGASRDIRRSAGLCIGRG